MTATAHTAKATWLPEDLSAACADVMAGMAARKTDPLLALAYWIEAAGDRRIENDVCAMSIMSDMRDRARKAIERHTGEAFSNPIYPVRP